MITWILQKAVTVIISILMIIAVLALAALIVVFFKDAFFDPYGLFFLGLGLIMFWAGLKQKAARGAELGLKLAALPFQLIMIYGAVAMILLSGLGRYLPESWEWPVDKKSSAIAFDSGAKAVMLNDLQRIQIYDPAGRYSKGWLVESSSLIFQRPQMFINKSGLGDEEETVLVGSTLNPKFTVFNLQGTVIGEKEKDYDSMAYPGHKAADFPQISQVAWYKWPLISELNGLICLLVGFSGSIGLEWLRILHRRRSSKNDASTSDSGRGTK